MASVLIVDDEESVRVPLQQFLLAEGHDVDVAGDVIEARLALARRSFDIVLSDIIMPGINGVELLKEVRSTRPDIMVIMMTAEPTLDTASAAVRAGATEYLVKPVTKRAITQCIASAARIKSLEDDRRREQSAREQLLRELAELVENLKHANSQLREAAAFREEVERIVHHDLKSPLNIIICAPEIIRMNREGLSEEQLAYLDRIQEAGRRMLDMINQSLDLFKLEQGMYSFRPERIDILAIAREVINHSEGLTHAMRSSVVVLVDDRQADEDDFVVVSGESLLCYSMLANLLKNALEASPAGATVTVRLNHGDVTRISIHNRGAVPESIRDRFFEKYVTAGKTFGTGLGTYSAKLIADVHGARMELDSSVPGATTVVVTFPAATDAAATHSQSPL